MASGATFCCSLRASHCVWILLLRSTGCKRASEIVIHGLSSWRQTGLVAPWHVGSSRPGIETSVPRVLQGRFLTTKEAPPTSVFYCDLLFDKAALLIIDHF